MRKHHTTFSSIHCLYSVPVPHWQRLQHINPTVCVCAWVCHNIKNTNIPREMEEFCKGKRKWVVWFYMEKANQTATSQRMNMPSATGGFTEQWYSDFFYEEPAVIALRWERTLTDVILGEHNWGWSTTQRGSIQRKTTQPCYVFFCMYFHKEYCHVKNNYLVREYEVENWFSAVDKGGTNREQRLLRQNRRLKQTIPFKLDRE